ncbi:hypothetical protein GGTG_07666 [Gaeumannomyces tritici R3-111a-1]|uniref:Uncharacterized protein n=1 Tax=Gaeumannomyces tritici (strain R3-111a-1) TaxID=644352 RepID=J3P2B9_GAET3|nr:hypothetical protein GGTG_07666 [Gaeumannomyces tritici R3-111a-1]EJT73811.1 hypothetical protein GGTG_07666 [Gaeumannomyces tritici R3-111a-1]
MWPRGDLPSPHPTKIDRSRHDRRQASGCQTPSSAGIRHTDHRYHDEDSTIGTKCATMLTVPAPTDIPLDANDGTLI